MFSYDIFNCTACLTGDTFQPDWNTTFCIPVTQCTDQELVSVAATPTSDRTCMIPLMISLSAVVAGTQPSLAALLQSVRTALSASSLPVPVSFAVNVEPVGSNSSHLTIVLQYINRTEHARSVQGYTAEPLLLTLSGSTVTTTLQSIGVDNGVGTSGNNNNNNNNNNSEASTSSSSSTLSIALIVGIAVGAVALVLIVFATVAVVKARNSRRRLGVAPNTSIPNHQPPAGDVPVAFMEIGMTVQNPMYEAAAGLSPQTLEATA